MAFHRRTLLSSRCSQAAASESSLAGHYRVGWENDSKSRHLAAYRQRGYPHGALSSGRSHGCKRGDSSRRNRCGAIALIRFPILCARIIMPFLAREVAAQSGAGSELADLARLTVFATPGRNSVAATTACRVNRNRVVHPSSRRVTGRIRPHYPNHLTYAAQISCRTPAAPMLMLHPQVTASLPTPGTTPRDRTKYRHRRGDRRASNRRHNFTATNRSMMMRLQSGWASPQADHCFTPHASAAAAKLCIALRSRLPSSRPQVVEISVAPFGDYLGVRLADRSGLPLAALLLALPHHRHRWL